MTDDGNNKNATVRELSETINDDGYRIFVRLIRVFFLIGGKIVVVIRTETFLLPNVVHFFCSRSAMMVDKVQDSFVVFNIDEWRTFRRAVKRKVG